MVNLRLQRTGNGPAHQGGLSACAYSPDSKFLLTGGWDGHLRLWEPSNGHHLASFRASEKPLSACAVSPNGKCWVSADLDGMLARWDSLTQQRTGYFLAHPRPVSAIFFSPDGQTMATASWDRSLMLWNAAGEECERRTLSGHHDIVAGCCFSADGKTLLSWSHDRTIGLWDVKRCQQTGRFPEHGDRVTSAAMSPDGLWAASGSRDRRLHLWNLKQRKQAAALSTSAEIRACFFLLDAAALVTAEANGLVRLFSVPDFQEHMSLATSLPIQCAALAPSGGQLALGCEDGKVHFLALDGFDNTPLLITATATSRVTQTAWQKLLGKSVVVHSFLCVCPACRESFELTEKDQPAPCPNCRRKVRVGALV